MWKSDQAQRVTLEYTTILGKVGCLYVMYTFKLKCTNWRNTKNALKKVVPKLV